MARRPPFTITQTGRPVAEAIGGGGLEGAERNSRDTAFWSPSMGSPDQIINNAKPMADARGRDLAQNDGYGQNAVSIHRDSIVGSIYRLSANPNWKTLARRFGPAFDEVWAEDYQHVVENEFSLLAESNSNWLDATRTTSFTGLVRLAIASYAITGEVLATAEWVREVDRPYNTCLQMVSPSRLTNALGEMDSATLRRGVQKDARGKPVAYHIRTAYPGDWSVPEDMFSWVVVPVEKPWGRRQVIHILEQMEPSQSRGISAMVAVLKHMRMTAKFSDIQLQRAVVDASYAAAIESELPTEVLAAAMGANSATDATTGYQNFVGAYLTNLTSYLTNAQGIAIDGVKMPHLYPGTKLNIRPMGGPNSVGDDFEVRQLRRIAAGLDVSYEELSKDYSQTNYSSARASMQSSWRHQQARKKFVADRFATECYALVLEEMFGRAMVPLPRGRNREVFYEHLAKEAFVTCEWIGAGRGQIDETKETDAAMSRLRSGLSTHERECAQLGFDWRDVFRQKAREEREMKALGLVLDLGAKTPGPASPDGDMPVGDTPGDEETDDE